MPSPDAGRSGHLPGAAAASGEQAPQTYQRLVNAEDDDKHSVPPPAALFRKARRGFASRGVAAPGITPVRGSPP